MQCKMCGGGMPCMAHGGEVKMSNPRERGVHHQREDKPAGESNMGTMVRRGDTEMAKRQAIDKKKDQRNASTGWRPLEGLAEGGVAGEDGEPMDDMADVDNELMDMACQELIDALHSKNKKEVLESLKAIILSCKE